MLRALLCSSSFLAIVLVSSSPAVAQDMVETDSSASDTPELSEEDLYKAVFGKEKPILGASRYKVIIDGVLVGDAMIDPSGEGWIESSFIEKNILPVLLEEGLGKIQPLLSTEKVSFSSLRDISYEVSFNSRDLLLSISIPMDQRTERSIVLRGTRNQSVVNAKPIADISAFLSVRAGSEWIAAGPQASNSPSGVSFDFDGAVNIKGVVLEGSFRYDEDSSRSWVRDGVRLVYDDVDNLIRYQAGDLVGGTRPEQNALRMAGIGAHREFRINPYDDPRPSGERGLVLDRPAQVEVIVNGASVRTLDLAPGRYSITDFPIMPGAINDVEFVVTYATGETEIISFPAFLNIELLDEGLSEFSLNVGVPYVVEDQVRRYDTSDFNFTGFYRKGISQNLTLGVSLDASSDLALVGSQVTWASPIGNFDLSSVMDFVNPGLDSSRMTLRHAWRGTNPDEDPEIDSIVVLTGSEYRTLDRLFDNNVSTIFAQSRVSFPLDADTRVQFGGSYEKIREDRIGDRWTASLSGSRRFGQLTMIGSLDWSDDQSGSNFTARISGFFLFGRTSINSSYTTQRNAFRTEVRRPAGFGAGSFGYSAGFEVSDTINRQFARANYIGNRFEAAIQQERFDGRGPTDIRTGFALGSALVMADGNFAVTRPVSDSFAIVSNGSTVDADIAVEPRSGSGKIKYSGESDWAGPAVVPDLPSYLFRDLEVESPDAPAGSGVGGEVFTVQPRYKSGYFFKSNEGMGSVSALGNLVDSSGNPVSLAVGTVFKVSDGEAEEKETAIFFTNSAGRFFIEGLVPGEEYQVIVEINDKPSSFTVSVPDDALGIWKLTETISLEVVQEEKK